jgi:pimeloyl-ACP methyl ester carboxylesterase
MIKGIVRIIIAAAASVLASAAWGGVMPVTVETKSCLALDGVKIVYSAAGTGEPALVFIHGGLAERSFWAAQLEAFAARHRVVALDLPGHGDSGSNRTKWGLPEFGADVKAVADAEKLGRLIVFGNSLGGPVAVEAALLLPGRAIGVVGVDTFQELGDITPAEARERARLFGDYYAESVKSMVKMLFHPDADPALMADAERRMQRTPPEAARAIFLSLAGYSESASARKLTVPLRAINGDLYPTDVAGVRKIVPGFAAVIMKHMGHYPMLERPDEFNRRVAAVVDELTAIAGKMKLKGFAGKALPRDVEREITARAVAERVLKSK